MSKRQLTKIERYHISYLLEENLEQKEIAEIVGFDASTISRELSRNRYENGYDPDIAQDYTAARKSFSRKGRKIGEEEGAYIEEKLKLKFTPEQIRKLLKIELGVEVSTQTIYNYIHRQTKEGNDLAQYLLRKKTSKRRKNKKSIERKAGDNRVSIDKRPEEINKRQRFGDLEIDTIVSKDSKGGALIICDRASRFTWGALIPNHKPSTINQALFDLLEPIKDKIHSITSDNGFEFRDWEGISEKLKCEYYFCHPYSSWERGTIENTNGIVRRDFPKGTNFSLVDEKEFKFRIDLMNIRPRKCIGFKTPDEVFFNRESFWEMKKRLHW